ncbi:EAL domain-containing protein [Methylobacillus caricis]|uniref:putative bifunctional diguanylate cyclase/phosphodiesterase n=1 Tax=Methylobacillus caricis TaxID=1971611 RepID=UPI001CFFB559|nr:GGDEF domain-containing phosphodiesterase [Methylobacillus caricis]MCB5186774.1 EAL domain-containing protein [Methylobacillus caricis]
MSLFPQVKNLHLNHFAKRVVLLYVLVGTLWILLSDPLFQHLLPNIDHFEQYLHYKRIVNMLLTATLLYLLVTKTLQQTKTQLSLNAGINNWKFVLEGPGDGVWDWDLRSNEIIRSVRWKEMFGYSEIELGTSPKDLHSLIHPDDLKNTLKDIEDFIKGKMAVLVSEFRLLCGDGSWRWVLSRGMLFCENLSGKPIRMIGTHTDITARKLSEERYFHLEHYDQITQLPNRMLFLDRLALDIKRSGRTGRSLTLMYLDLDKFKEVNDTLGHNMGNVLLKEIGDRLTSCVRVTDTVAHIGGDEFTIVLNDLDTHFTAEQTAQNILFKVAEPIKLGDDTVFITCSIGLSNYPEDDTDIEVLLSNADQAMYAAKLKGGNRYNYYTPSLQEVATQRMHLVNDLRVALQRDEFTLYYQPIVELATGDIHKAEALIRWQHPTRGLVSPAEFIPIAESTGLIMEIGNWVFEQAALQVAAWRKIKPTFQVSINKSPVQFKRDIQHSGWLDYLNKLGLPGSCMVIEITEGLLLHAKGSVLDKLKTCQQAGIQIAIDDFGTGYSSLSYLRKFDMDYLKIDQSFTSNITKNHSDLALCEVIILMAHKLDMKVIAEGIETKEQFNLLLQAGCDYGQGYLFSKPIPAKSFASEYFGPVNKQHVDID